MNFYDEKTNRWISTYYINRLKKAKNIPWLLGMRLGHPMANIPKTNKVEINRNMDRFFALAAIGMNPQWKHPFFVTKNKYDYYFDLKLKKEKTPVPVLWSVSHFNQVQIGTFCVDECVETEEKKAFLSLLENMKDKRSHKDANRKFKSFVSRLPFMPKVKEDKNLKGQWRYDFSEDTIYIDRKDGSQAACEKILSAYVIACYSKKHNRYPHIFQKLDMQFGNLADLIASFGGTLLAIECGFRKSALAMEEKSKKLAAAFTKSIEMNNTIPIIAMALANKIVNILLKTEKDFDILS